MVRLTADLLLNARTFLNPLRERELDARGYRIPAIENLGVTKDQFDTLDLSDNEIRKLECLAALPRIKMMLLSNNRVNRRAAAPPLAHCGPIRTRADPGAHAARFAPRTRRGFES